MEKEQKGTILAFIAAIISGFAIFANKIFIVDLEPVVFTAVRAMLIGLLFFLLSLWSFNFDLSGFRKARWNYLLAIGIIGGGLAFYLFFSGLKLTTAGRAAFLHKTLPLFTTIIAYVFLKEAITKKQLIALILMLAGALAISSTAISPDAFWTNPAFGDLLVIAATILWGVENVIAKKALLQKESHFVVMFGRMFFGAVFLFGAMLLLGKFELLLMLKQSQILNLIASAAILAGYVLTYYWSLKLINVSKASTILLFAPLITLLLSMAFMGEQPPLLQLAGSALILAGAFAIAKVKSGIEQPKAV
ncbi:MAG: DMT family transporter [Candidatus Aenigmarchaeota archaeon]|nr:DMT family transporter [Candidatus Aenigmarchaeota archaeon]